MSASSDRDPSPDRDISLVQGIPPGQGSSSDGGSSPAELPSMTFVRSGFGLRPKVALPLRNLMDQLPQALPDLEHALGQGANQSAEPSKPLQAALKSYEDFRQAYAQVHNEYREMRDLTWPDNSGDQQTSDTYNVIRRQLVECFDSARRALNGAIEQYVDNAPVASPEAQNIQSLLEPAQNTLEQYHDVVGAIHTQHRSIVAAEEKRFAEPPPPAPSDPSSPQSETLRERSSPDLPGQGPRTRAGSERPSSAPTYKSTPPRRGRKLSM
jgi:hypothetical protein